MESSPSNSALSTPSSVVSDTNYTTTDRSSQLQQDPTSSSHLPDSTAEPNKDLSCKQRPPRARQTRRASRKAPCDEENSKRSTAEHGGGTSLISGNKGSELVCEFGSIIDIGII
ncbi:unnamed protein product [Protopolystoma xenopodis]|uniref:Uncharacterized protein n=1 Tax=Protopolystoma xenopodis TaxID=117903 RepID=A0A448X8Z6_9PLAT|nr:unnamed protein product [Protopolystoma xenopodis]